MASGAAPDEVPVLIVGDSLVGLSAAPFLGRHGEFPPSSLKRHSGTAIHPRAAHFSQPHLASLPVPPASFPDRIRTEHLTQRHCLTYAPRVLR